MRMILCYCPFNVIARSSKTFFCSLFFWVLVWVKYYSEIALPQHSTAELGRPRKNNNNNKSFHVVFTLPDLSIELFLAVADEKYT